MTTGDVFAVVASPGRFGTKRYQAQKWERGSIRDDWKMVPNKGGGLRGRIEHFSRQSRANMTRTMLDLDYTPLFDGARMPVMVTLTLPGKWERVTPSSESARQLWQKFQRKFELAWGHRLVCVWKKEFQRRGAPHWHVLMLPPAGRLRGTGESFSEWLPKAWAECVGAQTRANGVEVDLNDPEQLQERREHVMEGARLNRMPDLAEAYQRHVVDGEPLPPVTVEELVALGVAADLANHLVHGSHIAEGNFYDPKRLAVYFAKHGLFSAKDYQNQKPESWETSGRMWGYTRGLEKAAVVFEIDADQDYYGEEDEGDTPPSGGVRPPAAPSSGGGSARRVPGDPVMQRDITNRECALSEDDRESLDEESWRRIAAEYVDQFEVRPKVFTERFLRRLSRENRYLAKRVVVRQSVDETTGEVTLRKRRVTRWVDHRAGRVGSGFVAVNDGIAVASEYQRLFAWHAGARDRELAARPPYEAGRYLRMQEERRSQSPTTRADG